MYPEEGMSLDELLENFDAATNDFAQATSHFPPNWSDLRRLGDKANDLGREIHWQYSERRGATPGLCDRTCALLERFAHRVQLAVEHPGGGAEKDIADVRHYGFSMRERVKGITAIEQTSQQFDEVLRNTLAARRS